MGTHPIFESDFDCLTETTGELTTVRILTDLADAIGDFAGINLSTPVPLPAVNSAQVLNMESFVNPASSLTITPLMRSIYAIWVRVIDK